MTASTTSTKPEAQTDADRAATVVAGRTIAPKPKRQSAASRKAAATQKPKPAASKPAASKSKPAAPKPAPKPAGLTEREQQHRVMFALIAAGADLYEHWNDPAVSKSVAGEMIAARLSYCPDAKTQW